MKELTKEVIEKDLRELLLAQFKGKEFKGYNLSEIGDFAIKYLHQEGINTINIKYDYQKQDVSIYYCVKINGTRKYWTLFDISIKKEKGDKHYSWLGGSYCDWTYKDFSVTLYGKSVQSRRAEINEVALKMIEEENTEKDEAVKAVNLLKEAFPNKDESELRKLISYLNDNKYTLVEEK